MQDWTPPPGVEDEFADLPATLPGFEEPARPATRTLTEDEPQKVVDLIKYLGDLSQYLPDDKKRQLLEENIPLKMERIRNTLSKTGSPREEPTPWPVKGEAASQTKQKLQAILDRLKVRLAE